MQHSVAVAFTLSLEEYACSWLQLVRLSDTASGTSENEEVYFPPLRTGGFDKAAGRFSQLLWTTRRGRPALAWISVVKEAADAHGAWAGVKSMGCDLFSVAVHAQSEGLCASWSPDGEALCVAAERFKQWVASPGGLTLVGFNTTSHDQTLIAWAPSSDFVLLIIGRHRPQAVFLRVRPREIVSSEHFSSLNLSSNLTWSSTGLVAFSSHSLVLWRVSSEPPVLEILHDLKLIVRCLSFAPCGWLLAVISITVDANRSIRHFLHLVHAGSGASVFAADLTERQLGKRASLAWSADSSSVTVCGPSTAGVSADLRHLPVLRVSLL